MTRYVEADRRDEQAFGLVAWGYDERPVWWKQTQVIWAFTFDSGRAGFATTDLEVAEWKIAEARSRNELDILKALFLHVPLTPITEVGISDLAINVEARHVAPFAREQVELLRLLKLEVEKHEKATRDLVVTSAQGLAQLRPYEQAKHMFTREGVLREIFFYGLTPAQMRDWAKGTGSYELEAVCVQAAEEQQAEAADAAATKKREQYEATMLRAFKERIKRSYFHPETPEEVEATRLHRIWVAAWNDPRNRERYAAERDAYIIEHIVRAQQP